MTAIQANPAAAGDTHTAAGSRTSKPGAKPGAGKAGGKARKKVAAEKKTPPRPDQLVDKLLSAAGPSCSRRIEVPLTAVATAVALLGAGPFAAPFLKHLATVDVDRATGETQDLWTQMEKARPFLIGHLDALLGWLRDDRDPGHRAEDVAAFQRCVAVLAELDLRELVDQTLVDGEILGPVYTLLRSSGSRKAAGAFFTPMGVCTMMAAMSEMKEGSSFAEPCSGAGAMAVAAAREMRKRGLDPATVRWVLNDIDPVAVALSGINAVAHGLGENVVLRRGDGLTLGLDDSVD